MEDKRKSHGGRSRSPLYLAMIVALSGASAATGADTAPAASNQNGLMTFPHVRVENAPQRAITLAPAAAQSGMRAYIDPETGALRPASPADLIRESQEGQAANLQQQNAVAPTQFVTQSGAIGLSLGESQMVFSVAQKHESGALNEFCVVGPEQATKLLYLKALSVSALQRKKEIRNDR